VGTRTAEEVTAAASITAEAAGPPVAASRRSSPNLPPKDVSGVLSPAIHAIAFVRTPKQASLTPLPRRSYTLYAHTGRLRRILC